MMANLTSYSLRDFIPYAQDIYYSLLADSFQSHFGLHLIIAVLNLVWIWGFAKQKHTTQLCVLSLLWFSCGVYFYGTLYAQLNWAAPNLAWLCYIQAFVFLALIPSTLSKTSQNKSLPTPLIVISVLALTLAPLWPVFQAMDWNALALPGLNSSALWALSFCTLLTLSRPKLKVWALLPSLGLLIISAVRFYAFHVI